MADMPSAPMPAEPAEAEAPPMAGDMSQGYCLELSVLPDGTFKVSGPEPLKDEAAEEQGEAYSEMGQDYDSIGAALKGVLEILKANPVGDSEQKQFDAGFSA